ncbi:MAG: ABC transporter substrate-binding protein [Nitrospinae bacterium]|nr:ABC transporter substrate-binding protein [Nitrospinota bacterium]
MNKILFSFFFSFLFLINGTVSYAEIDTDEGKKQLESSLTSLIEVLVDEKLKDNKTERRAEIKKILFSRFSPEEMSKRTLGKKWKGISKEEKEKFIDVFGKITVESYIGKIEGYSNEKVVYNDVELLNKRYLKVDTSVLGGKESFSVIYMMKKFDNDWLVFDIIIEGVSLVANYRAQFNSILEKKTFGALLNQLEESLTKMEQAK